MTVTKTNNKKAEAIAVLAEAGAKNEKREGRFGDTRTGWWLDGVFLAKDAVDAVKVLRGAA